MAIETLDTGLTIAQRLEADRLVHDLVSIPSPSGQEDRAAAFLADWMANHGFQAHVDASGSAMGIRGEGEHQVVLLGHIDTFPGEPPVRVEGRRLFGRGSVDAKGPLAAFAIAAALSEVPAGAQLVVIGASEEESATSRGARHALTRFNPAACLVGEPGGWDRITLGYKGRLLVDWRWQGPLAHSAGPIPSPAERAVAFWQAVQGYARRLNQGRKSSFQRLEPSLRSLNTRREGAYGVAEMQLGLRLPPDLSPGQVERDLRSLAERGSLAFTGHECAVLASRTSPVARALLGAVRAEGGRPRFVHKTGTSDMNVVSPVWRCPIAAYGPGDSRLDHTPREYLDLDEFLLAIAVLRRALAMLLRPTVPGPDDRWDAAKAGGTQ